MIWVFLYKFFINMFLCHADNSCNARHYGFGLSVWPILLIWQKCPLGLKDDLIIIWLRASEKKNLATTQQFVS